MRLTPEDDAVVALGAYAMFCAQGGLGNVLAGPVSEVLIKDGNKSSGDMIQERTTFGANKFAGVVGFTGGCLALSAIISIVTGFLYR